MKKSLLFAALALLVGFTACKKEEPDSVTLKSSPTVNVETAGGAPSIQFTANKTWTITSDQDWVKPTPTSGEAGEITVKLSVLKNEKYDPRTANITITVGTMATAKVVVTQGQLDGLEVKTTSFEVEAEGGTVEIPISTNLANFTVSIPAAVDWITLTKGMVDAKLVLTVAKSYDVEPREANILIKGGELSSTVKISQKAFEPYYEMVLPEGVGQFSGFGDGNPYVIAADATGFTIEVKTNLEHHCYFAPWDSEVGAAVETQDVGWIKFTYDNEKIVFTVEPNTTYLPREEYFYSGCFVGDIDFGAYGSCVLIRQEGLVPEAGASVLWTEKLSSIGVPAGYNRLAYKMAGGDALLVSDGEKVHVLNPADGAYWKSIQWTGVKPTSICSDDAGNVIVGEDYEFHPGTSYTVYYAPNVNEEPIPLFSHDADFDGVIGSWRVRGNIADRAVVTGFVTGNRYWAGWEIDKYQISMDNYYAQATGGQARGPIAVDADAWSPESGAVMSLGPRLNEGIAYRAYDTNWCLHFLADAYTPNWLVPYDWKVISDAGAGAGNENQNNMDIIDYQGRRIMAYTQGSWFAWGGNHDVYFLDVTNPLNTQVLAILSGEQLAVEETVNADFPYADVKLHVEEGLGLVCYVVNSGYGSIAKLLLTF